MFELVVWLLLFRPAVGLFRAVMWILYPAAAPHLRRRQWMALATVLAALLFLLVMLLEILLGASQTVCFVTFVAMISLAYLAGFLGWWIEAEAKHP
jgi:hypothetical protein